jgi:hypothetical protein
VEAVVAAAGAAEGVEGEMAAGTAGGMVEETAEGMGENDTDHRRPSLNRYPGALVPIGDKRSGSLLDVEWNG